MDETLQGSEPTAEGGRAPSEDVATAEAGKPHTAQFAPAETPQQAVSPAPPEDDGFPGGPIPESSGFSWRLPGQPAPAQRVQGGIPNEFDHLFRDAPEGERHSLMPNQGTIGVAVPGTPGYPGPAPAPAPGYPQQNPATNYPAPGPQPTQALPPADATSQQGPVYQPPTQDQVGYGQQMPGRGYDQGGYDQGGYPAQARGPVGPESHTQAIPRVPPQMYGDRGGMNGEPDLLLATGPDRRQSNRTLLVAIGVFVVLIVVAAVAFSGGGGGKSKTDTTSKSTNSDTTAPSTTAPAPPGVDPEAKAQADAIFAIIAQSHDLRTKADAAIEGVQGCQNVAANRQNFSDVAAKRQAQADATKALAVDKLPGGAKLKQDLITSWQLSAESENDYATWANDNLTCTGKPGANDNYNRASSAGGKAGTAKGDAVKDWNAFASKLGEQTIKISDL